MTHPLEDRLLSTGRPPRARRTRKSRQENRLLPDPRPSGPMLAITAFGHLPSLDQDPETSLVCSLTLHLMSEHTVMDAVLMDPELADAVHRRLHGHVCEHPLDDLRFRPGRAFEVLLSRHEQLRRAVLPDTTPQRA